jgi:hypothetical protein
MISIVGLAKTGGDNTFTLVQKLAVCNGTQNWL